MVFNWFVIFLLAFGALSYNRASLIIWTISFAFLMVFITNFHGLTVGVSCLWLILIPLFAILNIRSLRQSIITRRLYAFYRKVMPHMSRTESEAISAGTVAWEGNLFRGNPNWHEMLSQPKAVLSRDEQAFLDGPVETLCGMLNDWNITHDRVDLPPEVWKYIKENGFFGLIIPKQYGGKQFSAYAHSEVIAKIGGVSITAAISVSVPNSLGPAELLLHYGTEEQKNYYLPRLAIGEEVPCFALTSPVAGSDAGSMTDHGIVCMGEHEGNKVLGIRLNFSKRYITLAPIATVVGLAFKLYDPEKLLGNKEDIGITCALIPRETPGVSIGRRHFPLNIAFQNGPIQGKDVFIPLDWIIGGPEKAGKGWGMLMECLAAGRAISLPSSSWAGARVVAFASGAYARIRTQFNMPIAKFEGIEEPLARIAAFSYIINSARTFTTAAVDAGEKPSVASAIVKLHTTELGRKVAIDAMDVHGGKGICLGPKNYLGRGFQASPIAITVEGANILTRNMIIFGQGVIRCHPYILAELEAAKIPDEKAALNAFDKAVTKHIAFGMSNLIRCVVLGLTGSWIVQAPAGKLKRYYQQATRFSSALAFLSDVCMGIYGSSLKRKESISARLGDILSYLYLLSAVLKQFHDQGEPDDDLPVVRYATLYCLFEIQERFDEILKNLPNRWLAWVLKVIIFPLGERFSKPRDVITHKAAKLIISPTETRQRLTAGMYLPDNRTTVLTDIEYALKKSIAAEPIKKIINAAVKEGQVNGYSSAEEAKNARSLGLINAEQYAIFMDAEEACHKVIAVDDFANEDLVRVVTNLTYDYDDTTKTAE